MVTPNGFSKTLLIGITICSFLFGINTMQCLSYAAGHASGDYLVVKLAIATIWIANMLQLILAISFLYFIDLFVYNPHDRRVQWSIVASLAIPVIIYLIVTVIYSWRIYIISSRNRILPIIPILLATLSAVIWIGTVQETNEKGYGTLLEHAETLIVAYSSALTCDIYIAAVLSFYLMRGKSGLKRSNSVINKIVLYVISTGALSAILHAACLVTYITMSRINIIYAAIYIVVPEFFTNALLATLNARDSLRNYSAEPMSLPTLSTDLTDQTNSTSLSVAPQTPIDTGFDMRQHRHMMSARAVSFLNSDSRINSYASSNLANSLSVSIPWTYDSDIEISDARPALSPTAILSEWKASHEKESVLV